MKNKDAENSPEGILIPAAPAKAFFVDMITRDIELQDALLDLLDNCLDGVRRKGRKAGSKPYEGYYAHLTFAEDKFTIEDNCGGIPLETAEEYAFMMGRPIAHKRTKDATIGIYGIGMKRAIFKMGKACTVHSNHSKDCFEVNITGEWLKDDKNWDLRANRVQPVLGVNGTRISVTELNKSISDEFADGSDFRKSFPSTVRDAYSFLLRKGFQVTINGSEVKPHLPSLLWDTSKDDATIRPYIYSARIGKVDVFMAVGFRERPETGDNSSDALYRSEDAGWTIVCNDRVILPFDRSKQTGWGWGGVPSYHTQFIAISGFVLFEGDPSDLPMTTTKRGVDANSELYTTVRERMQEGLLHFTKFTNEWKGFDIALQFNDAKPVDIVEIKKKSKDVKLSKLKDGAQHLVPNLPKRPRAQTEQRISFVQPITKINAVSKFLFESTDKKASEVGEECFEYVFRKAKRV